ncbi:MAG TPA: VOC family protein [Ignavibacteriaceae bacterium]
MITINPYLNFPGNTEEAFNFYKSVFGGEFVGLTRFKDTQDGSKLNDDEKEKLMHVSLPIGKGNILMATDALESMGHPLKEGNNFSLSIETESRGEADKIFSKLSAGGRVTMPQSDTFWGSYFGMITDKYGIQWMVSYTPKTT